MAQHERTAGPTRADDPASATGAVPDPDAPHEEPNLSYIPALDGMRAFAVLGVMAFHGGIPWLVGGYLGVDTFFVLSGFLITTLLLERVAPATDDIKLGAFWARRARRLLPALLLVLLFVACYAAFIVPHGHVPGPSARRPVDAVLRGQLALHPDRDRATSSRPGRRPC